MRKVLVYIRSFIKYRKEFKAYEREFNKITHYTTNLKKMITKTKIELTEEELKNILCEHFNLQRPNATLSINVTKGDRPGEPAMAEIIIEAQTNLKK